MLLHVSWEQELPHGDGSRPVTVMDVRLVADVQFLGLLREIRETPGFCPESVNVIELWEVEME